VAAGSQWTVDRPTGYDPADLHGGPPMGRTFEKRKATMFKRWDAMAKAFTRCSKEITIAVKAGGDDPDANPALRRALTNARSVNMPKDKIQNAIDKALGIGQDAADYQELIYEGYGPHGVAILVTSATDNPTRTVANVRHAFKKGNGNLGASGSVGFMFDKVGAFRLSPEGIDRDELELDLIDHGLHELDDSTTDDGDPLLVVYCTFEDFGNMQTALEERGIEVVSSGIEYLPQNTTEVTDEQADEVLELVDRLEQDDDVQDVFHTLP